MTKLLRGIRRPSGEAIEIDVDSLGGSQPFAVLQAPDDPQSVPGNDATTIINMLPSYDPDNFYSENLPH